MVGNYPTCRSMSQKCFLRRADADGSRFPALRSRAHDPSVRSKTVVTVISKISERPVGKDACLVVIYGLELGRKYNLEQPTSSSAARPSPTSRSIRSRCRATTPRSSTPARRSSCATSARPTAPTSTTADRRVRAARRRLHQDRPHASSSSSSGGNIENAYHEEIYRLTTVDGLTQVFNRRYFLETLEREIVARQALPPRAVADHVRHRSLQEHQRHLRPPRRRLRAQAAGDGDQGARSAARTSSRATAARSSPSCCPRSTTTTRCAFAEKMRKLVEKAPFKFEDTKIPVTVSIGVATLRRRRTTRPR